METIGNCALCGKSKKLNNSHYLPKGAYSLIGKQNGTHENPIFLEGKRNIARNLNGHATKYALCRACEALFNDNGERYALNQLYFQGNFPIRKKFYTAFSKNDWCENRFWVPGEEVDLENLDSWRYFICSILWRGSAINFGAPYNKIYKNLGPYTAIFSNYLLKKGPTPDNLFFKIELFTDAEDYAHTEFPTYSREEETIGRTNRYYFSVQGVSFSVLISSNLNKHYRQRFDVSPSRTIFKAVKFSTTNHGKAMAQLAAGAEKYGKLR